MRSKGGWDTWSVALPRISDYQRHWLLGWAPLKFPHLPGWESNQSCPSLKLRRSKEPSILSYATPSANQWTCFMLYSLSANFFGPVSNWELVGRISRWNLCWRLFGYFLLRSFLAIFQPYGSPDIWFKVSLWSDRHMPSMLSDRISRLLASNPGCWVSDVVTIHQLMPLVVGKLEWNRYLLLLE